MDELRLTFRYLRPLLLRYLQAQAGARARVADWNQALEEEVARLVNASDSGFVAWLTRYPGGADAASLVPDDILPAPVVEALEADPHRALRVTLFTLGTLYR